MRPTRMMIAAALPALLLCLAVLASCSSAEPAEPSPSAESSDAAARAQLVDVDVSAVPSGPSVGELISVDDFTTILGRDDLTLAPAL